MGLEEGWGGAVGLDSQRNVEIWWRIFNDVGLHVVGWRRNC